MTDSAEGKSVARASRVVVAAVCLLALWAGVADARSDPEPDTSREHPNASAASSDRTPDDASGAAVTVQRMGLAYDLLIGSADRPIDVTGAHDEARRQCSGDLRNPGRDELGRWTFRCEVESNMPE